MCDFVGGALHKHGKRLRRMTVTWDFPEQIGFPSAGDPGFWKPLESEQFWASLSPCDDGLMLLALTEELIGSSRIAILSSSQCPHSCDGKRKWLDKYVPQYTRSAIFTSHKHLVASPGKLLIDDHVVNAEWFFRSGGDAMLLPRPWNPLRRFCIDTDGRFDVKIAYERIARYFGEAFEKE